MASNDYDDLLESFMSNSTKAYNEDKTNRENADTVPASYSVSSNSDKKQRKSSVAVILKKNLFKSKKRSLKRKKPTKTKLPVRKCFQI